jgi:hypothetical protein
MAVRDADTPYYRQPCGTCVVYEFDFIKSTPAGYGISTVNIEVLPASSDMSIDPTKIRIDGLKVYVPVATPEKKDMEKGESREVTVMVYACNAILGTSDPLSITILVEGA